MAQKNTIFGRARGSGEPVGRYIWNAAQYVLLIGGGLAAIYWFGVGF